MCLQLGNHYWGPDSTAIAIATPGAAAGSPVHISTKPYMFLQPQVRASIPESQQPRQSFMLNEFLRQSGGPLGRAPSMRRDGSMRRNASMARSVSGLNGSSPSGLRDSGGSMTAGGYVVDEFVPQTCSCMGVSAHTGCCQSWGSGTQMVMNKGGARQR
jgi:hypothetical protein